MPKKPTTTQIEKLIRENKMDELSSLLQGVDPIEVRMLLQETLGDHVGENYDIGLPKAMKEAQRIESLPLVKKASMNMYDELPEINVNKLYEEPIKKPVKLSIFKDKSDDLGFVDLAKKETPTINLNQNMMQKSPGGVILHETDHLSDALNKNYIPKQDMLDTVKMGLHGAEEAFAKHNKRGFFELEALKKLLANKKLQAAIPVVGAGLAAYSVLDSGDVMAADPTGMLQSDAIGEGSDEIPDIGKRDVYNAKMKKTRKLMGEE